MQDFKIINERDNRLFKRKEIAFEVTSQSAPSRLETVRFISERLSASPEKIKIKSIDGKFGSHKFHGNVFIYDSEEDRKKTELKKKKDEKLSEDLKPKEEPKVEEKQEEKAEETAENKEEAPEEKPAENKEENKEETKSE